MRNKKDKTANNSSPQGFAHGMSRQLKTLPELSTLGNALLMKSNENNEVLVLTSRFRWLTVRNDDGSYLSKEQNEFEKKLTNLLNADEELVSLNMKILLVSSPFRHKNTKEYVDLDTTLQILIKAGADVRYKKITTLERIILLKNELLVAESPNISRVVNNGFYYLAVEEDDFLIKFFRAYFKKLFDSAKRIDINSKGKLYRADSLIKIIKIFVIDNKEIISLIVGLMGLIIGVMSLIW